MGIRMSDFRRRSRTHFLAAFVCGWLSACGGGGSDGNGQSVPPSLTVTASTISVSATTAQTTPTSLINAKISNPGSGQYYFSKSFTTNGLASITATNEANVGNFTLEFKTPSSLAPGSYSDTLTIEACEDSACQQQIAGSPAKITVNYVVSEGPGTAPQLSSLGPNAIMAGGSSFQLIVTGTNFDGQSIVQWNGAQQPTTFISSTLLVASISSSDIAASGKVPVTVAKFDSAGATVSNALTFAISATALPTTLVLSTQAVNVSSNTLLGGSPILNNPVALIVSGSSSATYYYSISFTGSAVAGLTINGQTGLASGITVPSGPTAGRITGEPSPGLGESITGTFTGPVTFIDQIELLAASTLGAGTYTDTITVKVCTDAQCSKQVAGSPQSVAIDYTVTGNGIPNAQFTLTNPSMVVEAPTSGAAATGTTKITTNGLPPYGAYVFPAIGSGAAIAGATVQSNLDGSATLSVTTKPPASLGSGIYTDSVQLQICYDSACSKPATSAPLQVQVMYIVDASPGVDFTQATIPVQAGDMAWDATRQRIYATANSDTGGISQSLLVINPTTASIEQVVSLGQGSNPTSIALSDDGQYAYILSSIQVLRVDLGTLTVDETLNVFAASIKAVPGEPNALAVETVSNTPTLVIYDGTTARPQSFTPGGLEIPVLYTFGADASTLYAYEDAVTSPTMYQLSVSSNGLTVAQQTANVVLNQGNFSDIEYASGLIYAIPGSVYNPSTQSVQPSFKFLSSNPLGNSYSYSFAIDASLNRAYFITSDTPNGTTDDMTLEGFDLTTQAPTWVTRFPSSNPVGGRMIRWGTDGIAFIGGNIAAPTITLISGSVISR
jgi:hypothetical protein